MGWLAFPIILVWWIIKEFSKNGITIGDIFSILLEGKSLKERQESLERTKERVNREIIEPMIEKSQWSERLQIYDDNV